MKPITSNARSVAWRFGLLACLAAAGASSPAFGVYKCVGADGKVTYTDAPCAGGSTATRIFTPPPLTPREQAAAEDRSARVINQARMLEYRQTLEAAERQRRYESERLAEQQAEARAQRQAELEMERNSLVVVRPVIPIMPRPPLPVVQPKPRPEVPERPAKMRGYPFN